MKWLSENCLHSVNILFITRLYNPHIGGIEKVVENISLCLIKKNHFVEVITSKHDSNLKTKENIKGVYILRINCPRIKIIGLICIWTQMLMLLPKILKSDIVHIHDVFLWYLPIKILLPFKKVYVTFHGWEGRKITINSLFQKKFACYLSTKIMLVGKYLERLYGIKGDYITYGAVRENKQLVSKTNKSLVYLGRLDKSTDLPIVIKILKEYKSKYQITFVGDGELAYLCRKIGKVTGFVDPSPYLHKSRISIAGGYLAILESLVNISETVVMCSNPIRYAAYSTTPFSKYLYLAKDKDNLQSILDQLLDTKVPSSLTKKGYTIARKYTWEKLTNDYLKFWEKQ